MTMTGKHFPSVLDCVGMSCTCDRCQTEALGLCVKHGSHPNPCGNKRCPKSQDHRFKCTNSNEAGQVGVLEDE